MFKNLFKWGKKDKAVDDDNIAKQELDIEKEEIEEIEEIDEILLNGAKTLEEEDEKIFENEYIQKDTIVSDEPDTEYEDMVGENEIINDLESSNSIFSEDSNSKDTSDKLSFFGRLKSGLSKTRKGITEKVDMILKSYKKVEEELFEELEEVLITADVGVNTSMAIIEELRQKVKERKINDVSQVRDLLKEVLIDVLTQGEPSKLNIESSPSIILVVGVNGVGKTTTIGKLSSRLKSEGKKVLIAAGDTFRAAAIEQLQEWGNRAGVDVISHQEGSDPAAVIYDGIQAAKARKADVLICDTAGRLHNKKNLMNELNKIFRVVEREYPEAQKEVLLVVDATTGQNAVSQAKVFKEACDITGIVLTKLDGTAKGGVVLAVQSELNVPVKLVGVGEKITDLQDFDPVSFVEAIFEE